MSNPMKMHKKRQRLKRKLIIGKKKKYIQYSIPCLKDWERLNVDIKTNRKRFRDHFVRIIEENKKGILQKKEEKDLQTDLDDNFELAIEVERKRVQRGLTQSDFKKTMYDRSTKENYFLKNLW